MRTANSELTKSDASEKKANPKPKSPQNFAERMADGKPFDWLQVKTKTPEQG